MLSKRKQAILEDYGLEEYNSIEEIIADKHYLQSLGYDVLEVLYEVVKA